MQAGEGRGVEPLGEGHVALEVHRPLRRPRAAGGVQPEGDIVAGRWRGVTLRRGGVCEGLEGMLARRLRLSLYDQDVAEEGQLRPTGAEGGPKRRAHNEG